MADDAPVVSLAGVTVRRGGRTILGPIDWTVIDGSRWAIVGPNGAGKTTLAQVASTYLWPTTGQVTVLGQRMGEVDARVLRASIGYAGSGIERWLGDDLTALDVVMTARHAALGPWWHRYSTDDRARATYLLDQLGMADRSDAPIGVLSTGERRRVQIARALMPNPRLLILDEPAAGLDLGARETLVSAIDRLAAEPGVAAIVLISHHLEEIPAGIGSALLLSGGRVVAHGEIGSVIAAGPLSDAYGQALVVERRDGRFSVRGARVRDPSDPEGRESTRAAARGRDAGGRSADDRATGGRS